MERRNNRYYRLYLCDISRVTGSSEGVRWCNISAHLSCGEVDSSSLITYSTRVAGKIWYGMGYRGVVPYYGMGWDLTARSHTDTTILYLIARPVA